jgi:uncharacterized protein (TIGR00730 family)
MDSICVFCGSSDKINPQYLVAARQMGAAIAQRGIELWYGAGSTGLMGAVADGALESQGKVMGVMPAIFDTPELAHTRLTRLEVVDTMHERKERLIQRADAFIALPGGYGTFEELFDTLTWSQIGLHHKPVGLLNVLHYFDPLLAMVEYARSEGFIYEEHRALFTCTDNPGDLLDALENFQTPIGLERWLLRND